MADLGLMMIQMLSRSEKYLIKQYILTPLDLFNEINKVKNPNFQELQIPTCERRPSQSS
jgi:hypothetical protein